MQKPPNKNSFTQFSPIAPVKLLIELRKLGLVGSHLVVLAHDVVAHPGEYEKLFRTMINGSDDLEPWTIILDNGAAEMAKGEFELTGVTLLDVVCEAACTIYDSFPSAEDRLFITLPDTIGNWQKTVEDSAKASIEWTQYLRRSRMLLGKEYNWAAVMQGVHLDEQDKCMEGLLCIPDVKIWCVPRNLANQGYSRNLAVLRMINQWSIRADFIHLFGMSNDVYDDITATQHGVCGIDSANPLVLAHRRVQMHRGLAVKHYSREDFWTKVQFTDLMGENICVVQEAIRDGVW